MTPMSHEVKMTRYQNFETHKSAITVRQANLEITVLRERLREVLDENARLKVIVDNVRRTIEGLPCRSIEVSPDSPLDQDEE
jgi:regulator of replication initiation timing